MLLALYPAWGTEQEALATAPVATGAVFETGGLRVELNRVHSAPYPISVRRVQPHDISRGGVFYLYDRGVRICEHRLLFTRLGPAVVDALLLFVSAVKSSCTPFVWSDPLSGSRQVHLISGIKVRETLPNRLTVAMTVAEYLIDTDNILIDSQGAALLMADGSEMRGSL